jgi:hypothetical protein
MTREAKLLGYALLAILAIGASSAASAAYAHDAFWSETEKTVITGETVAKHKLIVGASSMECKVVERETTMAGVPSAALSFTPVYKECTFAGKTATVRMNKCAYVYTGQTDINEDAVVEVQCPAGVVIEVEVDKFEGIFSCTITFGPQTPAGGAHYVNEGEENSRTIVVEATLQQIAISTDGPGTACKELGGKKAETTGSFRLKGEEDQGANNQVGIWVQ